MTHALDAVMAKLAALPPEDQDRIARWLLAELASDEEWDRKLAASQDALGALADEALEDEKAGRTTAIDPDQM